MFRESSCIPSYCTNICGRTDGRRGDNNICTAAVFCHGAFPTTDDDCTTAAIYIYLNSKYTYVRTLLLLSLLLLCPRIVFSDMYYYIMPLAHIIGDEQRIIAPKNQERFDVLYCHRVCKCLPT